MQKFKFIILYLISAVNMLAQEQKMNENLIPFQNKVGNWGYMDAETDAVIIPAQYSFVFPFINGIAKVRNHNPNPKNRYDEGVMGFIRESGEELFSVYFTGIYDVKNRRDSIFEHLKLVTLLDGTSGIIALTGKWFVEAGKYESFEFYTENQYLADNLDFYDNGKKYTAPKNCKIIAIDFQNRFFEIQKNDNADKNGICTWEGKIIVEPDYLQVKYIPQAQTFLATKILGRVTLKNLDSKELTNILLDQNGKVLHTFNSKYFPNTRDENQGNFEYKNKQFFFDLKTGKLVDEAKSEIILTESIVKVEKTGLFGLKDKEGKWLIEPNYESIKWCGNDFLMASKNYLDGILDKKGHVIIPFEYRYMEVRHKNFIYAEKNRKYGAINFKNETIIEFKYNYNFYFRDGFAIVITDEGTGVIDGLGKEIIAPVHKTIFAQDKSESSKSKKSDVYFRAAKEGKWGLFDKQGTLIIPFDYGFLREANDATQSEKGWFITEDGERQKSGLINVLTNVNIPPIYNGIQIYDDFLIASKRIENDYTYQLLDLEGKFLSEVVYDKMEFVNGYFMVRKNKMNGILNTKGEIIVPLKYNYIWAESPNLILVEENVHRYYVHVKTGKEYRIKE